MAKGNILTRTKKQKAVTALQQNNLPEARKLLEQVYQRDRRDLEALFMLGAVSGMLGEHADAEKAFRQVTRLNPANADAHNNLGLALEGQDRPEEAISCFQNALRINPGNAQFHFNMANSLESLSRYDEAVEHYQKADYLQPGNPDIYANWGHALQGQGKLEEAINTYQKGLAINPQHAISLNNLGTALKKAGELDRAKASYRKALAINPVYSEAQHNLGCAFLAEGEIEDALAAFRKVVEFNPEKTKYSDSLLFTLNYSSVCSEEQLYQEHQKFEQQFALALSEKSKAHNNDCSSGRKLKIGYVSPDLRTHSVAYFFEPIMEKHDRNSFEIYCYANVSRPDQTTARLRGYASHWREIAGQSDESIAGQIRKDGIDILVDLAGHTANNNLLVFARKPAPVQITYLGYPNTTGLSAIDYRLTDEWADPEGQDQYYSEQLLRLTNGFLCYRPPKDSPAVSELPMLSTGHVTFGSFNNLSKMVPEVIELWSRILESIPGSRLIVKNKSFRDEFVRKSCLSRFEQHGVTPDRVELIGWLENREDHLGLYGRIDIGLDPFPYNGTTTTCEALWMGVPVVTLCGDRHAARVGNSLLHQTGLEELIAESEDAYLEIAERLAAETDRLQQLRSGLRDKMSQSPLCDEVQFTRQLENTYDAIWQTWCANKGVKAL